MSGPASRAALAVSFAFVALLLPSASAALQDPGTYPAGVLAVENSPVAAGADFDVVVELDREATSVSVAVCRFEAIDDATPTICYMPLGARRDGATWTASTSAVEHPDWGDGWVLGYKVMARTASGELHAPDRTVADGEYDYYRLVVGAPEGTAVVEDAPLREDPDAVPAGSSKDAPGPGLPMLALAVLAVGLLARRVR